MKRKSPPFVEFLVDGRRRIIIITLIFQVTGAILLAKGMIFKSELDVFLNTFSLLYKSGSNKNERMYLVYKESYISKIGALILIIGYFFPAIGWEYEINKLTVLNRIIFGVTGTALLYFFSVFVSNISARRKSSKTLPEELVKKYTKKVNEMGFEVIGG